MEHDTIIAIMKEICQIDADDNVTFQYIGDSEIKKDDVYGGFSINIEGKLDNVRQRFDIDLATADIVYPKSWAPFAAMEKRTELYGNGDTEGIKALEKEESDRSGESNLCCFI